MGFRCQAHRLMPRAAIERFQEWVYNTDHPIEALICENYFLGVRDRLLKGDVVEAYSVSVTRALHLRLLVACSDRQFVRVTPFVESHRVEGFIIQEASLQWASSVLVNAADKVDEPFSLELQHVQQETYRIVSQRGEVMIGGINGHAHGVELFERIRHGKISIAEARDEVKKRSRAVGNRSNQTDLRST